MKTEKRAAPGGKPVDPKKPSGTQPSKGAAKPGMSEKERSKTKK